MLSDHHLQPTRPEHAQAVETTSILEVGRTAPLSTKRAETMGRLAILGEFVTRNT